MQNLKDTTSGNLDLGRRDTNKGLIVSKLTRVGVGTKVPSCLFSAAGKFCITTAPPEEESRFNIEQILNNFNNSKIKGFVFTDVLRDGMLKGIDIDKVRNCLRISKKPLIVGGGLANENDLKNLLNLNDPLLEGVIAGKSFYLGRINLKTSKKIID